MFLLSLSLFLLYVFIDLRMFIDRDLNGNKIVELSPKIFSGLTALEYL